ncbi:dipeptidase 1-like isoform X1 [Cloeon dipterum]|uniref:dipeptidase 1-like isoform X1 n=2 Tax=Cloeon dipterum TaxID=197152 RepID=UPI00321FA4FB
MARWLAAEMPQQAAEFCKEGGAPRCCSAMDYLPRAHDFETDSNSSSSWDLAEVEMDMRRHIQQCSCTCNHMGFGNYMDYPPPVGCLPDVAPLEEHHPHHHNCPVNELLPPLPPPSRCNGRAVPVREMLLPSSAQASFGTIASLGPLNVRESFSSTSSKSDSKTLCGFRHWCLLLTAVLIACALGAGLGVPLVMRSVKGASSGEQRMDIVRRILKETPLIDGHNDFPWNLRSFLHNSFKELDFASDLRNIAPWSNTNWSHTDLPRMRSGLMGAQFWSAYVPCGARHLNAVQIALEQIDVIKRLADLYPSYLQLVTTAKEIEEVHRGGRIASLIGVEGGHAMGNSLAVLRMFYDLGARYLTLTHACNTPWAGCSQSKTGDDGSNMGAPGEEFGLTEFGKAVVREMNRLGMIVDLSHASVKTMRDALNATQAPLIFSHSSARALCNSTRNVPDDVLKLVTSNGGIVMVSFYPLFVSCNDTATITNVAEHINHIRAVAGVDHIGLGAGFDGINYTPRGLEDVGSFPRLFSLLLEQGDWSEEQLAKLAGKNLLRVLRDVEKVQRQQKLLGIRPGEEFVPPEELQGHTDCMYLSAPTSS